MERDSLGLIETSGLVAAIEAADAGTKAANVTFRGYERARAGLITVVFLGDVAAVRAAVTAGAVAAKRVGTVISVHVIARPDRQLHVASNGTKAAEAPAPSQLAEAGIAEEPATVTIEPDGPAPLPPETSVEEAAVSTPPVEPEPEIPQPEVVPEASVVEACENPELKEREASAEAEPSGDPNAGDGPPPVEEEEEVVAAVRATTHRKEKVRKPRSKRKA